MAKKASSSARLLRKDKPGFLLREDPALYVVEKNNLVRLEEAAFLTGKTPHNIRDYLQRGRITKFDPDELLNAYIRGYNLSLLG